jgi:predicted nicotinamide N-methyase
MMALRQGYMRMVPVVQLFKETPDIAALDADSAVEFQQRVNDQIIADPLLLKYPVAPTYRQLFLSTLLKRCDAVNAELLEPLVAALNAPIAPVSKAEDAFCYRVFETYAGDACFVARTTTTAFSTTGLAHWGAGVRLLEYSLNHRATLAPLHVLELGCGTALAALFWQRVCKKVTLTDYSPIALHNAQHNLSLPENGPCVADVRFSLLDFATVSDAELAALLTDVDLVCAADVLYTAELVDLVSDIVRRVLSLCPSLVVLMLQVQRSQELVDAFMARIGEHADVVSVTQVIEQDEPEHFFIADRELLRMWRFHNNKDSTKP